MIYPPITTDRQGDYRRLRVDVGQTGFFAGREFMTFYEFSIASGARQVIKIVAPLDTIVQSLSASILVASLRLELKSGGTEGGTFGTPLTLSKTNGMSTASDYTGQVTMAVGGTHTGGTLIEVFDLVSGTPASKAVESVVADNQPVGFGAGTYYINLINTDGATTTGIFRARFEERPVGIV